MKKLNLFYILLLCVWVFNVSAILDCDYNRDCRGLGANYICNASRNQCEETSRDEFFGKENCDLD